MKLINWNVNRSSLKRFKRQAAAISARNADILALTEVGIKAGPNAAELLKKYGFDHVVYSYELRDGTPKMSGILFASRYPFEVRPNEVDVPEHLWFRVLTADFDTPSGTVEGHGEVLWRRRFDHIFASPCLNATSAEYLHQFDEHSDHTPLEVVFGTGGQDFLVDGRSTSPNKNNHRRARFKTAWRRAIAGRTYSAQTLERLTWANLGWRLGRIFGETSEAEMDEIYDWAVRQQQSGQNE